MRDIRSVIGSKKSSSRVNADCGLWVLFQPLVPHWPQFLWKCVLVGGRAGAASLPGEADAAAGTHGGNFLQTHKFEGQGELINCSEPFHGTDCGISPHVP